MYQVNLLDMTKIAHTLIAVLPYPIITAVDMTVGNGFDTLFLAQHFPTVYGFDIQEQAIEKTKIKLVDYPNVQLILADHCDIAKYVKNVDLFVFNLGWLPNSDKRYQTKAPHTKMTLDNCLPLLSKTGIICILCYNGDAEQRLETATVRNWALSQTTLLCQEVQMTQIPHAPVLLMIGKKIND